MFAPVGRRDYDEQRIRGSESLLHVLARAGVAVHWRDNQIGLQGRVRRLAQRQRASGSTRPACAATAAASTKACCAASTRRARPGARHAAAGAAPAGQPRAVVLPPLPGGVRALHSRPARTTICGHCTREQIVNAYDNALLYTDHVLAQLIAQLQAHADEVDTAMLYVSDHGESLGEKGLFLHGMPYAIAPDEQTQVPMVMWCVAGLRAARRARRSAACSQRAQAGAATTTCSTRCSACST